MRTHLVRNLRFRTVEPIRFMVDRTLRSDATVRLLVATDGLVYTSEQQVAPLHAHRSLLRRELGVVFGHVRIDDALSLPRRLWPRCDAVLLKLSFRTPPDRVVRVVRRLRTLLGDEVRLIYLDGDDDLCIQWPDVLPWVDLYVKKHVFADPRELTRPRIGKTNLTDYVARTHGRSFEDDPIPRTRGVPADQLHKVALGWNIAADDRIAELFRSRGARPLSFDKDIDVICRATTTPGDWVQPLRQPVVSMLRRLAKDYEVRTPDEPVTYSEYLDEMGRARICVSPFGYGEICWRDFEAVLSGCLLVKPDVGHLVTEPNIFLPGETYVPVRWDYADLENVLRYYLERPETIRSMARRAHDVLTSFHVGDGFTRSFARVLRQAGVAGIT